MNSEDTGAAVASMIKESFSLETRNLSLMARMVFPTIMQLA